MLGNSNKNFFLAAKSLETATIQPSLVEETIRQELQKNALKYSYPANVGNAKLHQNASKFGYSPAVQGEAPRVCACCLERVQT